MKEIQDFYLKYDAKRKDKELITKGVAYKKVKSLLEKRKYLKVKYSDQPLPANTGICNDKMAIISWGEKPSGVLIKSRNIIEKQKEFFYALWNSL